jgi:hypothetical protein
MYSTPKFGIRKMILPKQKDSDGLVQVYIEVSKTVKYSDKDTKRKFRRVSCDVKIKPENWSKKKYEIKESEEEHFTKNETIDQKFNRVSKYVHSLRTAPYNQELEEEMSALADFFPSQKKDGDTEGIKYDTKQVAGSEEFYVFCGFQQKTQEFVDSISTGIEKTTSPFRDTLKTMEVCEKILSQALIEGS